MENLDELLKQMQTDPAMAIITAIATVSIILLVVLYILYLRMRSLRNLAYEWNDSQSEDIAGMEETHKKEIEEVNKSKDYYGARLNEKGIENDKLEDQLAISENRVACAEGKLKKMEIKLIAMDYAMSWVEKSGGISVKSKFEEILDCLKK